MLTVPPARRKIEAQTLPKHVNYNRCSNRSTLKNNCRFQVSAPKHIHWHQFGSRFVVEQKKEAQTPRQDVTSTDSRSFALIFPRLESWNTVLGSRLRARSACETHRTGFHMFLNDVPGPVHGWNQSLQKIRTLVWNILKPKSQKLKYFWHQSFCNKKRVSFWELTLKFHAQHVRGLPNTF